MNIRESYKIEEILTYPADKKIIFNFDFDKTLVKFNKHHHNQVGKLANVASDDWFRFVFTHATEILNSNLLLAFLLTTIINDAVQNFIHLKPAEKKTIEVINQLQAKEILMIVTARGFTLAKRTKEQLREANITINHDWLKVEHKNLPVELPLKYNFYFVSHEPADINHLNYQFSYVYVANANRLFYFNRFRKMTEININYPTFKENLDRLLNGKTETKLSAAEINFLIENHQPEKHIVVYHEGILYCEGQNKGEAIEAFLAWAELDKDYEVLFVDDQINNIHAVENVLSQAGKKFHGIHYKRVKESFDVETCREELKELYPHLPVKTRAAIFEIKLLAENSFFARKDKIVVHENVKDKCIESQLNKVVPKLR